ncbi:MAG: neutral/alkaline non-lysosomal ceramidase N-terminal domain-containing protein [Clostridia bacterium]|nr:neutral/alkaline non-lysosomal ceramidase N-terminal domain-containing protein [Clostridia bacterium]
MNQFQCGVARAVITPAVGGQLYGYRPDIFSESVADDLTVTAFYLEQGNRKALLLSATVCLIQTALSREILAQIEQRFGIPKTSCILSATHTHSGPNTAGQVGWGDIDRTYCNEIFLPAILKATEQAIKSAVPARMGVARGESLVGINRRELNENNELKLGQNPWGSFNPEMTILAFADHSGAPIANLIHYGCHGTAAGRNHEITRDWSGAMIDALEQHSGGITAFFNGPEGDVGPRLSNGKTVGDLSYVHELGAIAAADGLRIFDQIESYADVTLSTSHKALSIPLRKRLGREEAAALLEQYKSETVNRKGMMRDHFEAVVRSYEEDFSDQPAAAMEQTLIALNEIVFASFPYELFSEIGLRIDRAAEQKVLSLSNANGSEGYFITKDAVCRGGYEVEMFLYGHLQPFDEDADFYLMQETVNHIQSLKE